jgi:hypothetical protein
VQLGATGHGEEYEEDRDDRELTVRPGESSAEPGLAGDGRIDAVDGEGKNGGGVKTGRSGSVRGSGKTRR